MPLIREWLVPVHFRFFCDSFASALLPKLQHAIYSSGKISSVGAQQMLLDVCYVKKLLTQVPTGTNAPPTGHAAKRYLKFVSSEAEKVEMLLKTLLSPYTPGSTSFVDTYNSLVADRSEANFVKVLDIKGIKKMDQALLLDAFRSRNVDTGPKVEIGTDDDTLSLSKIGSKFFQEGGDGASSTTFSRFFS
uniref:Vps53 C-terminal domain-containing protein n=1 Tax=Paramoeba aestuarina TaxID=180227 RepID=A0A6U3CY91_9EUKA|mmetsp:Transcript_5483/g.8282  ORF Transcript_5483/g.8282 Transcript_5483/m.8282 type:complete len:190 (+) Transcript_5483:1-570(+)